MTVFVNSTQGTLNLNRFDSAVINQGVAAAIQFAVLSGAPSITAADFVVI